MTDLHPRCALLLGALLSSGLAASSGGCIAQGDFGGMRYDPTASVLAVGDRHELVLSSGRLSATLKPEGARTFSLLFTGARVGPDDQWELYEAQRLTTLRTDLAQHDGLLLHQIPVRALTGEGEYEVAYGQDDGHPRVHLLHGRDAVQGATLPLGRALTVKLTVTDFDPKAGGAVAGEVIVTRERTSDQDEQVAEGTVTWPFSTFTSAERRGKQNLTIAVPILRCAAIAGPTRAGGCAEEPAEPTLAATATIE